MNIERICGRRKSDKSDDGYEYACKYKQISYYHLEWVTRQQLDKLKLRKTILLNRFTAKLNASEEFDPENDNEILFVEPEYYNVERILDCVNCILEINPKKFLVGWRTLSGDEELPKGQKIKGLPRPWKERLLKQTSHPNEEEKSESPESVAFSTTPTAPSENANDEESAGTKARSKLTKKEEENNLYERILQNMEQYYEDNSSASEEKKKKGSGESEYVFERLFFVKWEGLSIREATWERACDIGVCTTTFHRSIGQYEDQPLL